MSNSNSNSGLNSTDSCCADGGSTTNKLSFVSVDLQDVTHHVKFSSYMLFYAV